MRLRLALLGALLAVAPVLTSPVPPSHRAAAAAAHGAPRVLVHRMGEADDGHDPLDGPVLPPLEWDMDYVNATTKRWVPGNFEIHMFEVGQGNSQLIIFPSGFSILIDVRPPPA